MPAERGDSLCDLQQGLGWQGIDQTLYEIEARTGGIEPAEIASLLSGLTLARTAGAAIRMRESIDQCAIVRAVTGGLDDDVARETRVIARSLQILLLGRRNAGLERLGCQLSQAGVFQMSSCHGCRPRRRIVISLVFPTLGLYSCAGG